jgi:hypothetical protein
MPTSSKALNAPTSEGKVSTTFLSAISAIPTSISTAAEIGNGSLVKKLTSCLRPVLVDREVVVGKARESDVHCCL